MPTKKAPEKPRQIGFRLYKKERDHVRALARRLGVSHAEIVRRALRAFHASVIG